MARSGVGELTLVDLDDVCVTNVNRQIHALDGEIGRSKVDAMASRVRLINPEATVHATAAYFTADNAESILNTRFDHVIDAIDNVANKCLLIAECRRREIPIITCGGAGGLQSGLGIQVKDLSRSTNDRLLKEVRQRLRRQHDFPADMNALFGVNSVFSNEKPVYPWNDGSVCETRENGADLKLDCASGFGTATFVTGAVGFAAAEYVVRQLAKVP